MFAYCNNNPIMYTDPNGNWPSWITSIANWVKEQYDIWKEESFVYNVIVQNITTDAGVGIGVGGEIKFGSSKLSAISRVDVIGVETNGIDVEFGHYGKSSFSVGFKNFSIGAESKNYESFDGTKRIRTQNVPAVDWSIGGEVGVVIAVHASVSVSFSGIYENFIIYGDKRKWWQ